MASAEDFDDDFEGVPAGGGQNDLKGLADGKYTLKITKADFKSIEKTGSQVVDISLEIVSDGPTCGKKYRHSYWLTNKDDGGVNEVSVGILKKDLTTLGFDVDQWKKANGRPFSGELKKAMKVAVGVEFAGKKTTNASGYPQLYIDNRGKTDGKPERFGVAELNAADKAFAPANLDGDY